MKTKNPMRGLLIFYFHAAFGNISLSLLGILAAMIVFLFTGNAFFFNISAIVGLLSLPLLIMSSMGAQEGRWERFQLTMPITRGALLGMQYLCLVLSLIIPVVLVLATIALSIPLGQGEIFEDSLMTGITAVLPTFSMPFLLAGFLFPMVTTRFGKDKETGLVTFAQFGAIGIVLVAPWVSEWLGVSFYMMGLGILAVSILIFIFSYFISRVTYRKFDF